MDPHSRVKQLHIFDTFACGFEFIYASGSWTTLQACENYMFLQCSIVDLQWIKD